MAEMPKNSGGATASTLYGTNNTPIPTAPSGDTMPEMTNLTGQTEYPVSIDGESTIESPLLPPPNSKQQAVLSWEEVQSTTPKIFTKSVLKEISGGFIVPGSPHTRNPITHVSHEHQASIGAEYENEFENNLQTPYSDLGLYSMLVMFSMLGALIRYECKIFSSHNMYDVHPRLYANMIGCMIMGALVMNKAWMISSHYAMYIGLGVGLCGSITSFSSWQIEVAMALVHWPAEPYKDYNGFWNQVIGSTTIQAIGIATTAGALSVGMMLTQIVTKNNYDFDASKPRKVAAGPADYKMFMV